MGAIYGSIIASGLIIILISGVFGKIVKFFPPIVTGSVVTIIGISLLPTALNNVAGGQGSETFGDVKNIILAAITLVVIILIYRFTTGFMRAIAILIGMIYMICLV